MINKDKNKFVLATLKVVKENIMENKKVIYNPIFISGLSYNDRYNLYFRYFNKDFNKEHKGQIINCEKLESIELKTKHLIIIENIDLLKNDLIKQKKILDLVNECLEENIQIIIGSNINKDELKLEEKLQNRLEWGLLLYLEE